MSSQCPFCEKTLSSKRNLRNHLAKPLPCDFRCRLCSEKCANKGQYYYHQKQKHSQEKNKNENEKEEKEEKGEKGENEKEEKGENEKEENDNKKTALVVVPRARSTALNTATAPKVVARTAQQETHNVIPIDDFSLGKYISSVERHHKSEKVLTHARGAVQVHELNTTLTTYTLRAEELRELIDDQLLHMVFESLLYRDNEHFEVLLSKLLEDIHAGKNARLHSICIGDIARKSVNFLSRAPSDKTYWAKYPRDASVKKIQDHACVLFEFIMCVVMALIKPGVFVPTGQPMWFLSTKMHVYGFFSQPITGTATEAQAKGNAKKLSMYELKEADVSEEIANNHPEILAREDMDRFSQIVIDHVHTIKLEREVCEKFLVDSYPICMNTMKSARGF